MADSRPAESGFSLVEIQIAIALLLVGFLGLAGATTVGMSTMTVNGANARAMQGAQQAFESIESAEVPFESLAAAFYTDPGTDPVQGLLDPIPDPEPVEEPEEPEEPEEEPPVPFLSRHFDVPGLKPQPGDADGRVGEVVLPVVEGPLGPELREDVAERDLNGDGEIDEENHLADYTILPVTVVVQWAGRSGPQRIELRTLLTRR